MKMTLLYNQENLVGIFPDITEAAKGLLPLDREGFVLEDYFVAPSKMGEITDVEKIPLSKTKEFEKALKNFEKEQGKEAKKLKTEIRKQLLLAEMPVERLKKMLQLIMECIPEEVENTKKEDAQVVPEGQMDIFKNEEEEAQEAETPSEEAVADPELFDGVNIETELTVQIPEVISEESKSDIIDLDSEKNEIDLVDTINLSDDLPF